MREIQFASLSRLLTERLGLELPPIAMAIVDQPPPDVPRFAEQVPSACTFWRRAEHGVFFASAADHFNCPIGAMVMGFDLPAPTMDELMALVGRMCQLNYIKPEEVPHIPKFEKPSAGIIYGPLAQFPLPPDVFVLWTTPSQAMLLQEAAGAVQWSDSPLGSIFGRPGCGALPTAVRRGKVTMSLGCTGMRTFTEIPDRLCLVAIPGAALDTLAEEVQKMVVVNEQMKEHYLSRKGG